MRVDVLAAADLPSFSSLAVNSLKKFRQAILATALGSKKYRALLRRVCMYKVPHLERNQNIAYLNLNGAYKHSEKIF